MEKENYSVLLAELESQLPPLDLQEHSPGLYAAQLMQVINTYMPRLHDRLQAQGMGSAAISRRLRHDIDEISRRSARKRTSSSVDARDLDPQIMLSMENWLAVLEKMRLSGVPTLVVQGEMEQDGVRYHFARPLNEKVLYLTRSANSGPLYYRLINFRSGEERRRDGDVSTW